MRSVVGTLIVINFAVYAVQYLLGDIVTAHLALWPWGNFPWPQLHTEVGFKPWQLLSYAFLHGSFQHIAFNMYGLFAFGSDVEYTLGSRRFCWLYFASVLAAGVIQLMVVTASVSQGVVPTLGASGGVFGVLLAFAVIHPHRRVMLVFPPIPMPAWLLVTGYGVIELTSGVIGTQQGVAHFAHLGGMLGAAIVLFVLRGKYPREGRDT